MINIRNSIFETNSSSMHSIIISKNAVSDNEDYFIHKWTKYPTLELDEDELYFGRSPFAILDTFEEKLVYLIASEINNDKEFKVLLATVNEILHEHNINVKAKIKVPKVKEYDYNTYKYTGNKVSYYGDIDHQSDSTLKGFLNKYHLTHKEFLENPNIIVVIDGDEYCYLYNMIDMGLMNKKSFDIYPKE